MSLIKWLDFQVLGDERGSLGGTGARTKCTI
jgi:hypothetical protein